MAIFSAANINTGSIAGKAVALCTTLRNTLEDIKDLQAYLSAQTDADLQALGFSASDLSFLRSAVADGNALAQIYLTGLPPGTYPQPASAYIYANSMRQIIGQQ